MRSTAPSEIECFSVGPGLLEDLQAGDVDRLELDGHVDGLAEVPGLVGSASRAARPPASPERLVRLGELRREVRGLVPVEGGGRRFRNRAAMSRNGSPWTRAFSISARSRVGADRCSGEPWLRLVDGGEWSGRVGVAPPSPGWAPGVSLRVTSAADFG